MMLKKNIHRVLKGKAVTRICGFLAATSMNRSCIMITIEFQGSNFYVAQLKDVIML